jgi:hypothetical protein
MPVGGPELACLLLSWSPRCLGASNVKVIERDLARSALADKSVKRLMTIPGIDMGIGALLGHRYPGSRT